ncbi:MAG: HAD family hydrolase, partial [Bacteroidales bacterium]|nr:HAD family hydrolase [Bacteroidales bacterium]
MQKSKTIFWDWNGTLLNDLHICIDAINILLRERNKPVIDQQIYRNIFTFPVRDYYVKAGFDFEAEPFEKPALEFIEQYEQLIKEAALFDDVTESLDYFRKMEYKQMILSAMQQDLLNELVSSHNIEHYFRKISGIDDHYATGKVDKARKLISGLNNHDGEIIMIGDTVHDHEVGKELGI